MTTDAPHLFDPTPYTKPRETPKRARPQPVEVAAAKVTEPGWYLIARHGKPPAGKVHRVSGSLGFGSWRTVCGIKGRALEEVSIGTAAYLCPKCSAAIGGDRT